MNDILLRYSDILGDTYYSKPCDFQIPDVENIDYNISNEFHSVYGHFVCLGPICLNRHSGLNMFWSPFFFRLLITQ